MSNTRIPDNGNVRVFEPVAATVLKVEDAELALLFGGLRCRVSTHKRRREVIAMHDGAGEEELRGGEGRLIYVGRLATP